jgi:hypothetical protein
VSRTPLVGVDAVRDVRDVVLGEFEPGDQLLDDEPGRRDHPIGLEREPPFDRIDVGGMPERQLPAVPHALGAVHRQHERHVVAVCEGVRRPTELPVVAVHDVGSPAVQIADEATAELGDRMIGRCDAGDLLRWWQPRKVDQGAQHPDLIGWSSLEFRRAVGHGEHDDVVAGPSEGGPEPGDVGGDPTGGTRRELPRQHQHAHGRAP